MVESTAFGQRVFGDFKVEFGQCVRLATERYAAGIDAFHLHHGHALRKDAELFGGRVRQIDDASTPVRTSVGDTHEHRLAVTLVGDTQYGAEGIGAVGAGEAVVMQAFAAARARASGTFRVERGLAVLHLCYRRNSEEKAQQ